MISLPVYLLVDSDAERLEKEFRALGLEPIVLREGHDLVDAVSVIARTGGRVEAIFVKDTDIGGPDDKTVEAILRFRKLPDNLTFSSGLKVKSIPIVLDVERIQERWADRLNHVNITILEPNFSVRVIRTPKDRLVDSSPKERGRSLGEHVLMAIRDFKRQLLEEFDNAGLATVFEGGTFRSKVALTTKGASETEHFYWPNKLRPQVLFLSPDMGRMSKTLAQYEKLINKKDVSEKEMQEFFERNPDFLLGNRFRRLWSQFLFPADSSPKQRTDFLLEPRVYPQISTNWEVLELKKPTDRLVTKSGLHRGFSGKVHRAIRQLRDYSERFLKNPDYLLRKLGHKVTHPRLALLIGKKMEADPTVLAKEQMDHPQIRLISYDEIQEEQASRFAALFAMNPFS